jgi:hypothetical protein
MNEYQQTQQKESEEPNLFINKRHKSNFSHSIFYQIRNDAQISEDNHILKRKISIKNNLT